MSRKETLAEIGQQASILVKGGLDERDEIIDLMIQTAEEEYELKDAKSDIEKMVDDLIQKHLADQEKWPATTDCDRLDKAFDELERNGVLTGQNFGYTTSDGIEDMAEKYQSLNKKEQDAIRGYVFFHGQDLERVLEDGSLMLAYGALDDQEKTIRIIGQQIQETLKRHEFKIKWNGKTNTRLEVLDFNWQRRRNSDS